MNEEKKDLEPQSDTPEQKQKPDDTAASQAAKPQDKKADVKPDGAAEQKPQEAPGPKDKEAAPEEAAPQKEKLKPDKEAEPEKKARPKECSACAKDIQKQWYYREGAYYCSKGCWKKSKKEAQEKTGKGPEGAK